MAKYDGWTIKNCASRNPWLVTGFFHRTKSEVIEDFEQLWGKGTWPKKRRQGTFKLVKVKLVEVA